MPERFILQCLNCHKILNEQPTQNELGPETLLCPNCKNGVPTPYISWRNARMARKVKLCGIMFGSTALGVYLVMILLIIPLLQNIFSLFGLPTQVLHTDTTRNIVFIYTPAACGLVAAHMMRRHYLKYT